MIGIGRPVDFGRWRAGRRALAGFIEVDETEIPLRTKADPVCGGDGRSPQGKMLVAGGPWPRRKAVAGLTSLSIDLVD
jgi:hypothetical protein